MGAASKVVLCGLRIWELICSLIVLGILASFLRRVNDADAPRDGRIVYGIVTASISTAFSIIFIAPFIYAFMAFPGDFILWVMWLVAFCLLETVCTLLPSAVPKLTFCSAHRHPLMQLAVVLELLGVLLGQVVEAAGLCHHLRFRMRLLAKRSGLLLYGHVCFPR